MYGVLETKMSRKIPPPTPVVIPIRTANKILSEKPAEQAISVPVTVKADSPIASNTLLTFSFFSFRI